MSAPNRHPPPNASDLERAAFFVFRTMQECAGPKRRAILRSMLETRADQLRDEAWGCANVYRLRGGSYGPGLHPEADHMIAAADALDAMLGRRRP